VNPTESDTTQLGSEQPELSTLAGKYQVLARLGEGGMALVYLAVVRGPVGFNKLVVLKRLRARPEDDAQTLSMFLDEARLAARLNHPNIVDTYDVGREADSYFIAMQYLDGQPLSRVLRNKRLTNVDPTMWVHIVAEVLNGLHHAHELRDYGGTPLQIVHRDISPHNIFVTYEGEVKIVDFGIAKSALNVAKTRAGLLKGKIGYMPPEQALGEAVDRRADIFAAGVVLWEAMVGRRLFEGAMETVIARLLHAEVPKLLVAKPDIDPGLAEIVDRSLKKNPDDRFATAAEMRQALLEFFARAPKTATKADLATLMRATFAEERATTQADIEKHLGSAGGLPPPRGNFWESIRVVVGPESPVAGPSETPSDDDSLDDSLHRVRTATKASPGPVLPGSQTEAPTAAAEPPPRAGPWSRGKVIALLAGIAVIGTAGIFVGLRIARHPAAMVSTPAVVATSITIESEPTVALRTEQPAEVSVNSSAVAGTRSPLPSVAPNRSRRAALDHHRRAETNGPATSTPRPESETTSAFARAASPPTAELPRPAPPPVQPPPARPASPAPGTMDANAVADLLNAHQAQIQNCRDRALMERPNLHGKLTVQAIIGPSGKVLSTSATSTMQGDARLQSCVLSSFRSWTFPPPAGGVNGAVIKTFLFE
jgi:serine/threonine-protein kinase